MRPALVVLLLLLAAGARAVVEVREFDDETLRARYRHFTQDLRCPKCQNQNLADSNAPIAADLRAELYRLLESGKSDGEIVDYMVARYGDYVLYRPPLERRTWLLWGAPFALLAVGGIGLWHLRSRRDARADADAAPGLSETERRRLAELLGEDESK